MSIRTVVLEDSKLKKLIEQKQELVLSGRKIAEEIDLIKEAQKATENKMRIEEDKVDVKDLVEQAEEHVKQLEELKRLLFKKIRENTPQELRDQYDQLEKQKDEKHLELNKLGHKVQKIKDKIIPIVQKLGKPHLEDEWEDFDTTKIDDDGKVVLSIFSRLEEWKTANRKIK